MKVDKEELKNIIFKKPFLKRLILMLIGVLVMGVCVACLRLCHFGTDPFSAMNYGISDMTGMDFGTLELIVNGFLLIIVLCFDYSKLGFGTLGNMVLVGYMADFTTFIMRRFMGITELTSLAARIVVMLIALFVFVVAVALYVNAGLGGSAYDALPFVLHDKLTKAVKKNYPFKYTRILFDGIFTIVAFAVHGEAGIITILMVFSLGPMIDFVAVFIGKKLHI